MKLSGVPWHCPSCGKRPAMNYEYKEVWLFDASRRVVGHCPNCGTWSIEVVRLG